MAVGGSGKGIQIVVGTDYNGKDLARAQRDLDRLKANAAAAQSPMKKLAGTVKGMLGPALMGAGIAAAGLAVKLGVDGVRAAIADQKTVEVLAQTLENLGQAHRQTGVEDFIASMESATGVADEDLRPALGQLVIATGDVDEAQRRLKQAMDISIGTGQNLTTVVRAFGRALATGTAGTLSRYGVIIDENTVKTSGFGAALDDAAGKFGGLADREAKTLEGRLRILGVELGNLQEAFGYGFMNAFDDAQGGMSDFTDTVRDLKPQLEDLGENVGTVMKFLGDLGFLVGQVKGKWDEFIESTGWAGKVLSLVARVLPGVNVVPLTSDLAMVARNSETVAYTSGTVAAALDSVGGATKNVLPPTQEMIEKLEAEADAAEKAAEEFDKLSGAIARTGAVTSYQASIDDLRKTLKETGGEASVFNNKGRETVDAYVDLAKNAGAYIETLGSQSQKASAASDTLSTLEDQLGNTKMDPATQTALLAPFQGLIDDLREAGLDVTQLQDRLDRLKSKTIDVTVKTTTIGGRPPGVSAEEWYGAKGGIVPRHMAIGGMSRGPDIVPAMLAPGEFVVRRQAVKQFGSDLFSQLNRGINPLAGMTPTASRSGGLTINGGITVNTVANEGAETSLPRALRRMAFLAGMNG